jgi:hypothetical protein
LFDSTIAWDAQGMNLVSELSGTTRASTAQRSPILRPQREDKSIA